MLNGSTALILYWALLLLIASPMKSLNDSCSHATLTSFFSLVFFFFEQQSQVFLNSKNEFYNLVCMVVEIILVQ